MAKDVPFLFVNPKSYYYGQECLNFAKKVDFIAQKYDFRIYFTCPYADLRSVAESTTDIVVTAQSMDPLRPGRGMGHILPESLKHAGAKAVVINHAENKKTLSDISECILRAHELDMKTIVCADSPDEAAAVACMHPDIILAEPTALIGTGITADVSYIKDVITLIHSINPQVQIMIASGVTTPEDCARVIENGADGTGSTSGIVKAPSPSGRVEEMVKAILSL